MSSPRCIEPEMLDALAPDDPRAQRARRDLQRVNLVMGHTAVWHRVLQSCFAAGSSPSSIAELGTGDGTLLLRLARKWAVPWPRVKVYLVDRQAAVTDHTLNGFAALGWRAEQVVADVTDWAAATFPVDLVMANLFLHHLDESQLGRLFHHIEDRTNVFAACEPRRSTVALAGSYLLGMIGCGPVTRYDAVVSVRAGFNGNDLASLWPDTQGWHLEEARSGLFTHTFLARRSLHDK